MKRFLKTIAASAVALLSSLSVAHAMVLPFSTGSTFETYLSNQLGTTDSTFSLAKGTYNDGSVLLGYQCFTIDVSTPSQEYMCGTVSGATASGATVTISIRGLNYTSGTSTKASQVVSHRRGADVRITDYPAISYFNSIFNGTDYAPNIMSYATTTLGSAFASSTYAIPDIGWVQGALSTASTSAVNTLLGSNNTWTGTNLWNALATFAGGLTMNSTFTANNAAIFNSSATGIYATASTSLVTNGRLNDVAIAGSPNASVSAKGIVQIATGVQIASSTPIGSSGAVLVPSADNATSTYGNGSTSGLKLVVTQNNGKIDPYLIATSSLGLSSSQVNTYTTPGVFNWVKPSNAHEICIVTIGGGGGGFAGNGNPGGGGGGGGALNNACFSASAATSTNYLVVGSGGGSGSTGATSTFGTLISAPGGIAASSGTGGNGGHVIVAVNGGSLGIDGAVGGSGGTFSSNGGGGGGGGSAGSLTFGSTANGQNGVNGSGGGGGTGGAGGTAGTNDLNLGGGGAGNPGTGSGQTGGSGSNYGGGGGGGSGNNSASTGGAGAGGFVMITTFF